jgi:hypothetical protein
MTRALQIAITTAKALTAMALISTSVFFSHRSGYYFGVKVATTNTRNECKEAFKKAYDRGVDEAYKRGKSDEWEIAITDYRYDPQTTINTFLQAVKNRADSESAETASSLVPPKAPITDADRTGNEVD